jgi:flagellar hook assembly protein FlgD
VPPKGRAIAVTFRLARAARVTVTVLDAAGRVVRGGLAVPAAREAGDQSITWNGLAKNGKVVAGALTVRVVATSSLGRSELTSPIRIRKTAAT